MRSLLLVRADRENEIEAALACPANGLVFDLAGILAGADKEKTYGRARAWLAQARQRPDAPLLYVLVSDLRSGLTDMDLDSIMPGIPDGIVLPSAHNGADIQHLSVKLAVREAKLGFADGATKIIAMVATTPASLFELGSFAGSSTRLAGLIFGADDLAQALGTEASALPDGTPSPALALAQSLALFAAKAAHVIAIAAASAIDTDEAGLRRACEAAKRDGFCGKLARHADQVAIINSVFAAPR